MSCSQMSCRATAPTCVPHIEPQYVTIISAAPMGLEIINATPTVGFARAYGTRSPTATLRRGVPPLGCQRRKLASKADISGGMFFSHSSATSTHGKQSVIKNSSNVFFFRVSLLKLWRVRAADLMF